MIVRCAGCGADNRVPADKLDQRGRCGRCKQSLSGPSAPQEVGSAGELEALLAHSPWPVVVDFWAAWCGPCRAVAPELERLARERSARVLVAKVDTERLPDVAARFGIRSIPTLIRFDAGRETQRVSGAMRADQLAQALDL